MNNLFISIQSLQRRLNNAGVQSIVIGGVAVAVWGEPRVTRDADLKVLLQRNDADFLLTILNSGYDPLLPDPRNAIQRQAVLFVKDADNTRLDLLLAWQILRAGVRRLNPGCNLSQYAKKREIIATQGFPEIIVEKWQSPVSQ